MADKDDVRSFEQIKAYPRGDAQGGRALQAVKGSMSENEGTSGHRTVVRETTEGRAIARTRDHMPMVEVEMRKCEIGVDHGVVDVLSVAPLNPDAYKDGLLYRTPFVAAHITGVDPADPERPIVGEIEPPDSIKGVAPDDGAAAKSMRAKKAESREALYAKKIMVGRCPPSIFTGRTRLYAQALYGLHDELSRASLDVSLPSATPAILIGDEEEISFRLSTNCGIHLDTTTGNHTMIEIGAGTVSFYPMEASDCIEELRRYLIDPLFPAADKERVETYILADSTVLKSKIVTVAIPETNAYSMGYGWHFNWDGDRADIVINNVVSAPGGGSENESTHYRLTFSKDYKDDWSAVRSIVEGPIRWKSLRHVHPITEPTWDDMVLEKFGAHLGPEPYGNAPFYAFYARNSLKVCRYSSTSSSHAAGGVTREPWYINPGAIRGIGSDPIEIRSRNSYTGTITTVSCGASSISFESASYIDTVFARSAPVPTNEPGDGFGPSSMYWTGVADVPYGQPSHIPTTTITDSIFGTILVSNGTQPDGWATNAHGPYPSFRQFDGQMGGVCSEENFSQSVSNVGQFIIVIPFYDSEAVFMYGQKHTDKHDVGIATTLSDNFFYFTGLWESRTVLEIRGQMQSASIGGTDPHAIDRTEVSQETSSFLVCNKGVVSGVSFPGKSGFWSAVDVVAQQYPTVTSASGNSVIASSNDVSEGSSELTTGSSFVGWA